MPLSLLVDGVSGAAFAGPSDDTPASRSAGDDNGAMRSRLKPAGTLLPDANSPCKTRSARTRRKDHHSRYGFYSLVAAGQAAKPPSTRCPSGDRDL